MFRRREFEECSDCFEAEFRFFELPRGVLLLVLPSALLHEENPNLLIGEAADDEDDTDVPDRG